LVQSEFCQFCTDLHGDALQNRKEPNGKIAPVMGRRRQAHFHVVRPVIVEGAHAA
jgi:hypothetical protein